jgi:hypothetical protein
MLSQVQHGSKSPDDVFPDPELERVCRCLIETTIDARREHVEVLLDHGWATLTGEVATARCRCDVERHLRSLAGVKGLTNHIDIVAPSPIGASVWPRSGG